MKNITIVGGGASGLVAAITAARTLRPEQSVAVNLIERNGRVGKKLLSTGNGRCNLSNSNISAKNYLNDSNRFATKAIGICNVEKTLDFFASLGLLCKTSSGGRIYPYCEQASAVLDVLRFEIAHLGINLITDTNVTNIIMEDGGFKLFVDVSGKEGSFSCDKLILSTGGRAAPKTGSDGNGFDLLASLGHNITSVTPALTQLKTDNIFTKALKGIKINGSLHALSKGKTVGRSSGEIIFTDYGLSGSAVFDISGAALAYENVIIELDMLPEFKKSEIISSLSARRQRLGHLPREDFFIGLVNKRLGQALCKLAGVVDMNQPVSKINDDDITKLAGLLKKLEFKVKGHTGWDFAQTSRGGASSVEFDFNTMESLVISNLYATGELLDFTGECGGYNLQWAWTSGILSGEAAARSITS